MTAVEGSTDPTPSVALRLRALMGTREFRGYLRLLFIALYSLAFVTAGFGHWSQATMTILTVLVSVLWVLLLVVYVRDLRSSEDWRGYVRRNLSIPLLLIAPLFLLLYWDAVWFSIVIVAYVLELRQHSAGRAFTFSFWLIIFIGVLSAFTMDELENDVAGSQFQSPADAFTWAFGSLLRIDTGKALTPTTDDGHFLSIVVKVSAILVASLFTAKLVAWVIGSSGPGEAPVGAEQHTDGEVDSLRAELAAMRIAIDQLTDAVDRDRMRRPPDA